MEALIQKTPSAYEYPLLIKNLFFAPLRYDPAQEIVYKDSVRLSYATFRERVARLASALIALGVKKGDTVAVFDWDSHRYLECYFAIPMIGAVLHTINVRLSAEQLAYTMAHAEDSLVIVNSDFLPLVDAIKGRLDTVRGYILSSDAGATPAAGTGTPGAAAVPHGLNVLGSYEELLAAATPLAEFPDFDENTRATTFYTTGTTGMPKGVYFSHRQLVLHTIASAATLNASPDQGNFHSEDVYMPLTPMFHVHAWGIPYIATFLGVKQVYPGKYIPPVIAKLIATEKVTFSHCVPTILAMVLGDPSARDLDVSNWKVIIGGAALPKTLAALALSRGIDIFAGYGMSETCPVIAVTRLSREDLARAKEDQIDIRVRTGSATGLTQIRVIDGSGKPVAADDKSPGEIQVRAPWLTQGYLKDSTNSEKLWEGGWLHTQDVACVNGRGSLRITDRLKDVIKVGGEWLSSLELEDIILAQGQIAETAVIGKADAKWGEVPLAAVVLKEGAQVSEHRVIEHVKSYIDRGIVPREALLLRVAFVPSIPKTSVGKANKQELRKALGAL